jgi:tetratricopeptide (TPR) repeat protein
MSAALGALAAASDPVEAGRGLRATAVMMGEYRRSRSGFEVSVKLIDTRTAATLWRGTFHSSVSDLMQAERTIVGDALAAMLPEGRNKTAASPPDTERRDATAHYLYLLARGKIATWQSAPIPEAVELLEQAISLDPDFAPAHAELATASANMFLGGLSSDPTWIARAVAAGSRAVYLDDRSAAGHSALGAALLLAGDPVASTRETIRALQLDPGNAYALRALANLIAGAGHPEPVRALRDAARRADPSIEVGWLDVWLAMIEGNYKSRMDALRDEVASRRAAGLSPELPMMQLGALCFEAGDTANQLRWATMLDEVTANKAYADMLRLLAMGQSGDKPGMKALVEKNRDFYMRTWEYCDLIGRGLASMGETEDSLAWIERSVERGNYDKGTWERSPMLDGLRGNSRFETALTTVKERTGAIVRLAEFAGYM